GARGELPRGLRPSPRRVAWLRRGRELDHAGAPLRIDLGRPPGRWARFGAVDLGVRDGCRGRGCGLMWAGLLVDGLGLALWTLASVMGLAALVRTSQVAKEERA